MAKALFGVTMQGNLMGNQNVGLQDGKVKRGLKKGHLITTRLGIAQGPAAMSRMRPPGWPITCALEYNDPTKELTSAACSIRVTDLMEHVDFEQKEGLVIAKLLVSEINLFNTPALKEELDLGIETPPTNLILNFYDVAYIDSTGIGMLIGLTQKLKGLEAGFFITNLAEPVAKMLKLANVHKLAEISPTVEEALAIISA